MKTISIDVRATDVQVTPGYNGTVNLMADIDEHDVDNILDSMSKDSIVEYVNANGYTCELSSN